MTRKEERRFTLRIVPDLAARLEKMSVEQGIAKNALIVNILWHYIRKDATP